MTPASRPKISANLAISADGKIASDSRPASGWTSHKDFERLLQLRSTADAIMVGRNTLIADRMTLRSPRATKPPLRCVVARNAEIPNDHPLFSSQGGPIHWLSTQTPAKLTPDTFPTHTVHHQTLSSFLSYLKSNEIDHLHCEGGGSLIFQLASINAIDTLHLTIAGHTILGGANSPTLTGNPLAFLPQSLAFTLSHFETNPEAGECYLSFQHP